MHLSPSKAIQTSSDALGALKKGAEELNVFLNEAKIQAFGSYLRELKSWSEKLNLVRRKDEREIITKDFLDSLTILKYLPIGASLLDFGSGAGFPGIPVKIARGDLDVLLLEVRKKRVVFLLHIIRLLELKNLKVFVTGNDPIKKHFDFVVFRSFGSIKKMIENGGGYLKRSGTILSMKGKNGEVELSQEIPFLQKGGWRVSLLDKIKLPILGHDRVLIGFKKNEADII